MIRTFHPVGQGNFITEQFENGQNVIFDCGTTTSKDWIRELVKHNFQQGDWIDGVFISSLDREHAGGLEALMQWCRVEKVFIPYLHEEERAYTLLKHLCEGGSADDLVGRLITEPKKALAAYQILKSQLPIVTQVAEETLQEKNVFDARMPMYLMPWKAISGFRVYADETMDWVYQVHVYRQEAGMKLLTDSLQGAQVDPGWVASAEAVKQSWQDLTRREKLEQAYRSLQVNFCAAAMVVYAGPEWQDYPMYEQFTQKGKWTYYARIRAGSLYMGDLYAADESLCARMQQDYHSKRALIGTVLLPGHGDEGLFHESILPKNHAIVVATADGENEKGLPHGSVIRRIMERHIPFYLVSELPGSTVRFAVKETVQ